MAVKKNKQSMAEKVVIQRKDNEMASRIVGTIFIVVGVILVGLGIYSFVTYNVEPELDENLNVPVLSDMDSATNDKEIVLKGTAEDLRKVRIFINDELVDTVKVEDGKFTYDWSVEDEGIYVIKVDGLKGFPRQKKSSLSESVILTVDWTSPSSDISLEYISETSKDSFTLKGTTEPVTTVYVKRGTSSFSTTSDEDGNFELTVDLTDEGKNVFNVVLVDKAGNETIAEEKVRITYSPDADLNGNGTADSDELPEASGNLTEALEDVSANRLMAVFGLLAILVMTATSFVLYRKERRGI